MQVIFFKRPLASLSICQDLGDFCSCLGKERLRVEAVYQNVVEYKEGGPTVG